MRAPPSLSIAKVDRRLNHHKLRRFGAVYGLGAGGSTQQSCYEGCFAFRVALIEARSWGPPTVLPTSKGRRAERPSAGAPGTPTNCDAFPMNPRTRGAPRSNFWRPPSPLPLPQSTGPPPGPYPFDLVAVPNATPWAGCAVREEEGQIQAAAASQAPWTAEHCGLCCYRRGVSPLSQQQHASRRRRDRSIDRPGRSRVPCHPRSSSSSTNPAAHKCTGQGRPRRSSYSHSHSSITSTSSSLSP